MMRHSASENPKLEVKIPKNALGLSHTQHGIPKGEGVGVKVPGGQPPPAVRRF